MSTDSDSTPSLHRVQRLEREMDRTKYMDVPEIMNNLDQVRDGVESHLEALVLQRETRLQAFQRGMNKNLQKWGESAGMLVGAGTTLAYGGDVTTTIAAALTVGATFGRVLPWLSNKGIRATLADQLVINDQERVSYWHNRIADQIGSYSREIQMGEIVLCFPAMAPYATQLSQQIDQLYWLGQVSRRTPKSFTLSTKWDSNGQIDYAANTVGPQHNHTLKYDTIVSILEPVSETLTREDIINLSYGTGLVCTTNKGKVRGAGFLGEVSLDSFKIFAARKNEDSYEHASYECSFSQLEDLSVRIYGLDLNKAQVPDQR